MFQDNTMTRVTVGAIVAVAVVATSGLTYLYKQRGKNKPPVK